MDAPDEARIPLSLLVDRMAGDGPRNEAFVRRLCAWLHERADRLSLDAVEALGLVDVVLTFRMKAHVTLVATGRRPDRPGEVTIRFVEADFPHLGLAARRDPRPEPYRVCTLDYAREGEPVEVALPGDGAPRAARGRIVVDATVDGRRRLRVRLDDPPGTVVEVEVPPDVTTT